MGPTVFCAEEPLAKGENIFMATAHLIVQTFEQFRNNDNFQELCNQQADLRLGRMGGTQRIVDSINTLIPYK